MSDPAIPIAVFSKTVSSLPEYFHELPSDLDRCFSKPVISFAECCHERPSVPTAIGIAGCARMDVQRSLSLNVQIISDRNRWMRAVLDARTCMFFSVAMRSLQPTFHPPVSTSHCHFISHQSLPPVTATSLLHAATSHCHHVECSTSTTWSSTKQGLKTHRNKQKPKAQHISTKS